jgi:integrase
MAERKSLTDANVIALEARAKKYEVWDSGSRGIPGFCVRVEASGCKTFYFRYSLRGLFWYRIGPAAMGAALARTRARELIGDVARGINPHRQRIARIGGLTFEQLQKRYVEEHAKKHNKAWKQGDYLCRAFAMKKLGKLPANEITRADVRALIGSISAPQTANQVKAAISAVFSFGVREEVVKHHPCRDIMDNPTKSRDRILSPEEIAQFWAACDQVHPVKGAALKAILLTGQRPGEICHMRIEHVKSDGWWELPGDAAPGWPGTKNGRTHFVWLSADARALISTFAENGIAFPNECGRPIGTLDVAMREISASCNFKPVVKPHDLRRTFASTVTRLRFGGDAMDRLLNHYKKSAVRNTYDRNPYGEENKLIWERVGGEIARLAKGEDQDGVVVNFASRGA